MQQCCIWDHSIPLNHRHPKKDHGDIELQNTAGCAVVSCQKNDDTLVQ